MPEEYGTEALVKEFLEEAEELFAVLDHDLLEIEALVRGGDELPQERLDEMFRAVHTIKGLSAMFDLTGIKELAHAVENVFDRVRKNELKPDRACLDLLFHAVDVLKAGVAAFEQGAADDRSSDAMREEIRAYLDAAHESRAQAPSTPARGTDGLGEYARTCLAEAPELGMRGVRMVLRWGIELRLGALRRRDIEAALGEGGEVLEVRPMLDEVVQVADVHPTEGDMRFEVYALTASSDQEIADRLGVGLKSLSAVAVDAGDTEERRADEDAAPKPAETVRVPVAGASAGRTSNIIRVDIGRLDGLVDLTGEIVTARTRLQELTTRLLAANRRDETTLALQAAMKETGALVDALQETVMGLRMVPVGNVFSKLPRIVRDLTKSSGKEIRLDVSGEDTELDKRVIEQIEDPLLHILRNSCDHGVEDPEERLAAGKDRVGVVSVSAWHEGSSIVIECRDDGRGLDTERILAKALASGVIDESDDLGAERIAELIMAPGFSTAERVSDVSGRGVGLDVVRRKTIELGGRVEVTSERGAGTVFQLRIPLTLAIIPALLVASAGRTFALPLATVRGVLRVRPAELTRVQGLEVMDVRGESVAVLRLNEVLRLGPSRQTRRHFVVEVSARAHVLGLLVDGLLGQQEIVVKNLEDAVGETAGVSGATILGDGTIVPILDIDDIVHLREESLRKTSLEAAGGVA